MKYKLYTEYQGNVHIKKPNGDWKQLQGAPRMFATTEDDSDFKSMYGKNLKQFEFNDVQHARSFIKDVGESVYDMYGSTKYAASIVSDSLPTPTAEDDYEVGYFDIETECENGFPDPMKAKEKINMITFIKNKSNTIYSFTTCDIDEVELKEIVAKNVDHEFKISVKMFDTEKEMLLEFINWTARQNFDIITGWSSAGFDIPYLGNRITKILGADFLKRLSPFGNVRKGTIQVFSNDLTEYTFKGMSHLDMLQLYKKFTFKTQPNYRLDTIAKIEINAGKLEHESGIKGHFLYKKYPTSGLAYNIIDVVRLKEIDNAFGGISTAISLAQMTSSNPDDVLMVTRLIFNLLYDYLQKKNVFMPLKIERKDRESPVGGYVMAPVKGIHKNVISVDLASSYTSIMRSFNISPETKRSMIHDCNVDRFLTGDIPRVDNHSICPNGQTFTHDFRGIMPEVLDHLYAERQKTKAQKLKFADLVATTDKKDKDYTHYKHMKKFWSNQDSTYKVILNSFYGALAEFNFIFFDVDLAEAITMTGQYIVRQMGKNIEHTLSKPENILKIQKRWEKDKHKYLKEVA